MTRRPICVGDNPANGACSWRTRTSRSWPAERVETWALRYWAQARAAGLPLPDEAREFRRAFDWMGLQRHLKVIGMFARINKGPGSASSGRARATRAAR